MITSVLGGRCLRTIAVAAIAGFLLLAGLQPASAASTPSKVGMVSFTAASYSQTNGRTSLTIDWSAVRNAKSYQVFMSRSYSMSHARTYATRSTVLRVTNLTRGASYFFQVRGVNGSKRGSKSSRVGHTTIIRQGSNSGPGFRVMTYNVCSVKCDDNRTTPYSWTRREPGAFERIAAYRPDVVAAQEASQLNTPPGYRPAIEFSAKVLLYKTSRFDVVPDPSRRPPEPARDRNGCSATYGQAFPTGHIFLGWHDRGCRYAVWAKLIDKQSRRQVLFVDVHTVAGTGKSDPASRQAEMNSLFLQLKEVNTERLPVVIAGDFNSHKHRANDSVATVMHRNGMRDAYDLARRLYRQHYNSYNGFETRPRTSYTWGDHVDHVWTVPGATWVDAWRNGVRLVGNRLPQPIPSDHSPVVVDLRVN